MKKLVILSQENIDYVFTIAKVISDKRSKRGDFSKALRLIIEEYQRIHANSAPPAKKTEVEGPIKEGVVAI